MNIIPTKGQAEGLVKIDQFLQDDNAPFFLLKGSAGTGKTYLMTLVPGKVSSAVIGTAPTHKAVKVLQERFGDTPCMTIHAFLGLRPRRSKDKTVLVRRNNYDPTEMMHVRVVVVDEASMIDSELLVHIKKDAKEWDRKYLFVGDSYQLPPVSEETTTTPVFQMDYGPYSHELMEIVRQASDNPIIQVATDIRNAIIRGDEPDVRGRHAPDTHLGVYLLKYPHWEGKLREYVHMHEPDAYRVLAYRNDKVREYNNLVRGMLGHDVSLPFDVGEFVVVNEAYTQNEDVVLNTGVELEVSTMTAITHPVYSDQEGWMVKVFNDGTEVVVPVLNHEKSGEAYKSKLNELANKGRQSNDWRGYYSLAEFWCDLRPLYALTTHKSQGSTFDNVFVDLKDIYKNRCLAEADRCLYVATTRARYNVYVLI